MRSARILVPALCSTYIALACVGAPPAAAEPMFAAPFISYDTGGHYASSIAIADVDEDGRPDILALHEGESAIAYGVLTVLLSNGDGTFRKFIDVPTPRNPTELAVGDLDSDGHFDLAVADGLASVDVLRGVGDGSFVSNTAYGAGSGARSLAISDLNGDSRPDLVVANWEADSVTVFRNETGGFARTQTVSVPGQPMSVRLGDLDSDGNMDAAVACYEDDSVRVLLGNGDGTLQPPAAFADVGGPVSIAVRDLNGDGHLDLATAHLTMGSAGVFLGNGDGSFRARFDVPTGKGYVYNLAVTAGDVNGDAHADLIMRSQNEIAVLLGDGTGSFVNGTAIDIDRPDGFGLSSVAIGDLDGDGSVDLAATTRRWFATAVVVPGNGDGTFGRGARFVTPLHSGWIAAGDLNADGRPDIVATSRLQNGTVSVLLGRGDGNLHEAGVLDAGIAPGDVALADFDGDETADIAVANNDFHLPDPYEPPLMPRTLSIFHGHGDGTFAPRSELRFDHRMTNFAAGDLNGDGIADLIVPDPDGDRVGVRLSNGDGSFGEAPDLVFGGRPGNIALGDLDANGTLDLVVATATILAISIGQGDGTFVRWPDLEVSFHPRVLLADFDRDGHLDLVENGHRDPRTGYPIVTLHPGNGDGTFGARLDLSGWNGVPAAAADLNADGRVDLVTAGFNIISVLLGGSSGGFLPKQDFGVEHGPMDIAIADLNSNGRPEIVLAAEGFVQVLVNNAQSVPTPVEVEDFAASISPEGALLTWRLSGSAARTLRGVHVQRAEVQDGPFATLTREPLAPGVSGSYVDATIEPGREAWYRLLLLDAVGSVRASHALSSGAGVERTLLLRPVEDAVGIHIRYRIAHARTPVELAIYDVRGRRLWSWARSRHDPGAHVRVWDGRDGTGTRASRGVYFVRLRAAGAAFTQKFLRLLP